MCNEALSDRKSLEDGEEYHVLIARARAFLYDNNDDHVVASLKNLDEAIGMKPALTGPYWIRAESQFEFGRFPSRPERFRKIRRIAEAQRPSTPNRSQRNGNETGNGKPFNKRIGAV